MKKIRPESKRMTSIARKIHRGWLWRLFRAFLFLDIVIILLSTYAFVIASESSALGSYGGDISRGFEVASGKADFLDARNGGGWDFLPYFDLNNWESLIESINYTFTSGSAVYVYPAAPAFALFCKAFYPLLLTEMILLVLDAIMGSGGSKRVLKPIRRMADDTLKLTRFPAPARDFHDIETAISSIEPEQPSARLNMGDKELVGLEDAINDLLERMREAYREQTRFVSDASHELRTPIAVIQGYANMLDRWGKQDESILNESIQAIKSESEHMKELIEQLLFLARGDNGKHSLKLESFSLSQMVTEAFEEYEMIDSRHKWKIESAREVSCVGDEGMIKQTLRILADNAIKYTPDNGTITLKAFPRGELCCFSVQDTGIGISPEDAKHVFERFYRADSSRDQKAGGYGLGLSIAQWIVQRHKGFFEIMSWPNLGTRITVCLPKGKLPEGQG